MKLLLILPDRETALALLGRLLFTKSGACFFFDFACHGDFQLKIEGVSLSTLQLLGILDGIKYTVK